MRAAEAVADSSVRDRNGRRATENERTVMARGREEQKGEKRRGWDKQAEKGRLC